MHKRETAILYDLFRHKMWYVVYYLRSRKSSGITVSGMAKIFCLAYCFTSTVNSCCHVGTVNCLTILLLGKPSRGSLPVVSVYFSVSNLQLALLKSEKEGKKLRKKMQDTRVYIQTACIQIGIITYRATEHGRLA